MADVASDINRPEWADSVANSDQLYLTTFGTRQAKLFPLAELSVDAVAPLVDHLSPNRGGTSLRWASNRWLDELDRRVPKRRRLDLHLVTDGRLHDGDIAVIHEFDIPGHTVHIHLIEPGAGTRRELAQYKI